MSQPCLPFREQKRRRPKGSDDVVEVNDLGCKVVQTGVTEIEDLAEMDAMDYLAAVREEACKIPDVCVAPTPTPNSAEGGIFDDPDEDCTPKSISKSHPSGFLPIDGSAASIQYMMSTRTRLAGPTCAGQLPASPDQWTDALLKDFTQLRHYMEQCAVAKLDNERVPVPALKDGAGWNEFCVGTLEAEGNVDGYFDDKDEDEDKDDSEDQQPIMNDMLECNESAVNGSSNPDDDSDEPEWRRFHRTAQTPHLDRSETLNLLPIAPTVPLLLQMDQVMTRRVLSHMVTFVADDAYPITRQRGLWIYALLARLEGPLHSNEEAMLTQLLRHCCQVRSETTSATNSYLPMINAIIAIVSIFFEQSRGRSCMTLN